MSTHDYIVDNQNGANFRSDLNNALAAIVSNNSSATAPTTTYAFMLWADTASDLLKQRNAADSAWINILTLSTGAPLATIANFTSTGIDDNATSTKLTISDTTITGVGAFTSTSIDATKLSGTVPNFTSTGIDDNATSTAITIDASENVGIGTVPQGSLSVNTTLLALGNRISLFEYDDGSNPAQLNLNQNDRGDEKYKVTGFASRYQHRNGVHNFQVAPSGAADSVITWTTAMTIDNSGNVLVGKTTAGAVLTKGVELSSSGAVFSATDAAGNSSYFVNLATSGTRYLQRFYVASTSVGSIASTGTSTAYNTSSDYRLKELDVPMEGSIDRLKALRPINFAWKIDGSRTDGFLAHEAGEVVPECATGTKDAMMDEEYEVTPAVMDGDTVVTEAVMGTRSVPDYQGIDQSKLVPLLVASLQEAVAKIEALEARVTALEV